MAWTSPRTWVVGEVLTAALLNTHLRDNLSYLKATPALDSYADLSEQSSAPSAPGSALVRVYARTDGQVYTREGASGAETPIGKTIAMKMALALG